jgi:hypothetical protein
VKTVKLNVEGLLEETREGDETEHEGIYWDEARIIVEWS